MLAMLISAPGCSVLSSGKWPRRSRSPIRGGELIMIKRVLGLVVVCGAFLAAGMAQAHHSLSGVYDIKTEGEVTGVLTKVAFTNPHGAMHLDVKNADGSTT